MKTNISFFTIFLSIFLVSCSSKEDEPVAFSADYYGEFITLTPITSLAVDEINPKDVIEYLIINQVPYETFNRVEITDVPKAERETSKYSVSLHGDLAHILYDKEVGEEGMKTQYNVTTYRFKVGSYKVMSEESATPFERYIVVSHEDVKIEVWYDGNVTDNVRTILIFPNQFSSYSIYDDGVELEPYYHPIIYRLSNHYEEYGKAVLNSDGNYTLKFDFSSFSLNPQTGYFIQLTPEYLEIGTLDKR